MLYSTFLPFFLLLHSGLPSPSIPSACLSHRKALVSSERHHVAITTSRHLGRIDKCRGGRRLEGTAEVVKRGMDGGQFMLQFGTELCLSDRGEKKTHPWLNDLVHASVKIKKRCATTVFSHRILQPVFSNNIPHHMLLFSRQRN
jgi:hypothetical protein